MANNKTPRIRWQIEPCPYEESAIRAVTYRDGKKSSDGLYLGKFPGGINHSTAIALTGALNDLARYREGARPSGPYRWDIKDGKAVVWNAEKEYVFDGGIEIEKANHMAAELKHDLNELEAYREERRWRPIGEEWPEDGQLCQMLSNSVCPENFYFSAPIKAWGNVTNSDVESDGKSYRMGCTFTHWRPMPMDVPKEEG